MKFHEIDQFHGRREGGGEAVTRNTTDYDTQNSRVGYGTATKYYYTRVCERWQKRERRACLYGRKTGRREVVRRFLKEYFFLNKANSNAASTEVLTCFYACVRVCYTRKRIDELHSCNRPANGRLSLVFRCEIKGRSRTCHHLVRKLQFETHNQSMSKQLVFAVTYVPVAFVAGI